MEKLKVLHVVSVSFSLKHFIGNQFAWFKKKGIDFSVACTPSDNLIQYANEMEFQAFPVKILRRISPIQDFLSVIKLFSYIKKNRFDIVVSHSPKGGLLGMLASYLAGTKKRVFFRHGLVFETERGLKRHLLIFMEKLTGSLANQVVHVSESLQKLAEDLNLNSSSKNVILNIGSCNGIDTKKFARRPKSTFINELVVGFVGRLCKDKGVEELLEAWKTIIKSRSDVRLLLVGPIDERTGLSQDSVDYIYSENSISYVGEVSDTSNWYNEMDIFVLPSHREGFGMVNLEAAASELPVITTLITGCKNSIIENVTGTFTNGSPHDLVDKILLYVEDKDLRENHGKSGREFVQRNFSEQIIYNEIWNKILSD